MSEVPNSLAEQQPEPVPIQVKNEGSDKMDEAGRLQDLSLRVLMYIFCNEEPLWLRLCLNTLNGPLEYKGLWKKTVLHLENVSYERNEACRKPLSFDGFDSVFLYRRLYRCHTTLDGFSFDMGMWKERAKSQWKSFLVTMMGRNRYSDND